ncbi:MAG: hypothetical protein AAFY84_09680 [Pseudomonadota bacterium]
MGRLISFCVILALVLGTPGVAKTYIVASEKCPATTPPSWRAKSDIAPSKGLTSQVTPFKIPHSRISVVVPADVEVVRPQEPFANLEQTFNESQQNGVDIIYLIPSDGWARDRLFARFRLSPDQLDGHSVSTVATDCR